MEELVRRELASRRTALISAAEIAGRCFREGGPDPGKIFDYFYRKFCEELGIGRLVFAERKMGSPFIEPDDPLDYRPIKLPGREEA